MIISNGIYAFYQPQRGVKIIDNAIQVEQKTRRVNMIKDIKDEWREYHPVGVFFHIVIHPIIITSLWD